MATVEPILGVRIPHALIATCNASSHSVLALNGLRLVVGLVVSSERVWVRYFLRGRIYMNLAMILSYNDLSNVIMGQSYVLSMAMDRVIG